MFREVYGEDTHEFQEKSMEMHESNDNDNPLADSSNEDAKKVLLISFFIKHLLRKFGNILKNRQNTMILIKSMKKMMKNIYILKKAS